MDFITEKNRIFLTDDSEKTIAEVTFPDVDDTTVNINHTFVDESLRGQGVAAKIMLLAAEKIRAEGKKARLTCSYAVKWFEKNPEYNSILVKD